VSVAITESFDELAGDEGLHLLDGCFVIIRMDELGVGARLQLFERVAQRVAPLRVEVDELAVERGDADQLAARSEHVLPDAPLRGGLQAWHQDDAETVVDAHRDDAEVGNAKVGAAKSSLRAFLATVFELYQQVADLFGEGGADHAAEPGTVTVWSRCKRGGERSIHPPDAARLRQLDHPDDVVEDLTAKDLECQTVQGFEHFAVERRGGWLGAHSGGAVDADHVRPRSGRCRRGR